MAQSAYSSRFPSHPGSCPQLPGEDQLFLPSSLEYLSDACSDNNPVVCRDCTSRGEGRHDYACVCANAYMHKGAEVKTTTCIVCMCTYLWISTLVHVVQCNSA